MQIPNKRYLFVPLKIVQESHPAVHKIVNGLHLFGTFTSTAQCKRGCCPARCCPPTWGKFKVKRVAQGHSDRLAEWFECQLFGYCITHSTFWTTVYYGSPRVRKKIITVTLWTSVITASWRWYGLVGCVTHYCLQNWSQLAPVSIFVLVFFPFSFVSTSVH